MKLIAIVWGPLSTGVQKGLLPSGRLRALDGLGGKEFPTKGIAGVRAEAGRARAGFRTEELGSLAGARGLQKGQGRGERRVSREWGVEASQFLKTQVSTSVRITSPRAGPGAT